MFTSYGVGMIAAVGFLPVVAVVFAFSVGSNQSSDAARNELSASVSVPDQSNSQRKTGCPQGKRKLPTQITPLP
jgi:hypothetical protein